MSFSGIQKKKIPSSNTQKKRTYTKVEQPKKTYTKLLNLSLNKQMELLNITN